MAGFITFLARLSHIEQNKNNNEESSPATESQVNKEQETSQVRFDFYEILKEHQVEVDTKPIEQANKQNTNIVYWLQAASFKNPADAEKLRAKLIFSDLPASTEKTINKSQEEWHRVLVGPFTSRSKLAKARSILASQQINSFVIKRQAEKP